MRYGDTCAGRCGGHFTLGEERIPHHRDPEMQYCIDCATRQLAEDLDAAFDIIFNGQGALQ